MRCLAGSLADIDAALRTGRCAINSVLYAVTDI